MGFLLLIWCAFVMGLASLLGASTGLAVVIGTGSIIVPLWAFLIVMSLDDTLHYRRIEKARRKRIERHRKTSV